MYQNEINRQVKEDIHTYILLLLKGFLSSHVSHKSARNCMDNSGSVTYYRPGTLYELILVIIFCSDVIEEYKEEMNKLAQTLMSTNVGIIRCNNGRCEMGWITRIMSNFTVKFLPTVSRSRLSLQFGLSVM